MSQTVFKFDVNHDYSPENFLVSSSNREAFEHIKSFPWNFYALSIHGPKASGKTYLANILAAKSNAIIIEDINSQTPQVELLHTLNKVKETNGHVLLTSEKPLNKLGFALPDLVSRLSAIVSVHIDKPDAEIFHLLFARYFAARQLKVSDDVIAYLAGRVERSFLGATQAVEKIDKLSLEQKRNITIPLVKQVI